MAIDKSLSQAPLGLDQLDPEMMGDEPALEISIEDPESVEIGIDGQPILRIEEAEEDEEDFDENLAEVIRATRFKNRRKNRTVGRRLWRLSPPLSRSCC